MAVVYGLINTETSKVYIGCTKAKISKRLREHRCLLRGNKHSEMDLQVDWFCYGEKTFEMRILEEVGDSIAERREAEKRWMDHFYEKGLLYNRYRFAFEVPPDVTQKGIAASAKTRGPQTKEANLKRSLSQKGKPKGHGWKISATKQAQRAARLARLQNKDMVGPAR